MREKFWDWATASFVRFGVVLVVAHAILTAPLRKKENRHG